MDLGARYIESNKKIAISYFCMQYAHKANQWITALNNTMEERFNSITWKRIMKGIETFERKQRNKESNQQIKNEKR